MSEEQFTNTLREYIRRQPFIPFVVELTDGQRVTIPSPEFGFGGGAAGFLSDTDGLVNFRCEQVSKIAPVQIETVS